MDDTKSKAITAAASDVFLRYGFRRTTMGDIAQAAGISRPALYLVFPNKENVFQAVAHYLTDGVLDSMRAELGGYYSLEDKLRLACTRWAVSSYELIQAHPDAYDLFDLSFPVIRETHQKFQDFLAGLLDDELDGAPASMTSQEIAHTLIFALRGFVEGAVDGTDIHRMIEVQLAMMVKGFGLM